MKELQELIENEELGALRLEGICFELSGYGYTRLCGEIERGCIKEMYTNHLGGSLHCLKYCADISLASLLRYCKFGKITKFITLEEFEEARQLTLL